jgi:predicted nucleic acid-binding protein
VFQSDEGHAARSKSHRSSEVQIHVAHRIAWASINTVQLAVRESSGNTRSDSAGRPLPLHVPDPRPFRDSMIAATAREHGFGVVTRNVGDFADAGVQLVNPFA